MNKAIMTIALAGLVGGSQSGCRGVPLNKVDVNFDNRPGMIFNTNTSEYLKDKHVFVGSSIYAWDLDGDNKIDEAISFSNQQYEGYGIAVKRMSWVDRKHWNHYVAEGTRPHDQFVRTQYQEKMPKDLRKTLSDSYQLALRLRGRSK